VTITLCTERECESEVKVSENPERKENNLEDRDLSNKKNCGERR
jgi:hypothetical protein